MTLVPRKSALSGDLNGLRQLFDHELVTSTILGPVDFYRKSTTLVLRHNIFGRPPYCQLGLCF